MRSTWIGCSASSTLTARATRTRPSGGAARCSASAGDGGFERFAIGTPDYPNRSATLLLPVRALSGGAPLRLSDPGIETERMIAPTGLPTGLLATMAANLALFPRGFDLVLVHGTAALALPRTTRVRDA